jgi:putative membrane protein
MPRLTAAQAASLSCLVAAPLLAFPAFSHIAAAKGSSSSDAGAILETLVPIALAIALYARGLFAIWHRSGQGRAQLLWRATAFAGGLVVLCISLLSPLDRWGSELFAAHMVQHELLMLGAAPLLVLGRPLRLFLWAFGESRRHSLTVFAQNRGTRRVWAALLTPWVGWLLHALALWLWHIPAFFDAVLRDKSVHDAQHLTFLLTALVFWSALLEERRRDHQGAGILYLFTTTIHTSVLGALITFASHPWYASYLQTPLERGLTPLEDQQLGGLIMWVPGSLVYVGIALALLARWIRASEPAQHTTR